MDKVRLGRALGYGTRHAAKTVAAVMEAAVAPDPAQPTPRAEPVSDPPRAARERSHPRVRPTGSVGAGVRNLKRSFWQPLAVFSGALWLRVTGLFFALLAITMGGGAWRLRGSLGISPNAPVSHRAWAFAVFAVLFGYFAISSFVRASLKERQAAIATR